jgi:hypothetical protein
MPMPEQRQAYRRDGCLVVPDAVSRAQLAALHRDFSAGSATAAITPPRSASRNRVVRQPAGRRGRMTIARNLARS